MKKYQKFIALLVVMFTLSISSVAFASDLENPSDEEIKSVSAILLGDTDFTISPDDIALLRSGNQQIRIEKYITLGETLEDGTVVMYMSDVAPMFNQSLPVYLTLTQISSTSGNYRYSVVLEIPLIGSGTSVKSFSATIDYGDGSSASNYISYDSFETISVELKFPDKYYKAGRYTARITNYNLLISSANDLWNPSTEQAGLANTMFNITVPK